ncbi:trypsin-like peptidase domain-containing protein [Nocardioides sp.]|uniref:S1C family serine protease n=1 Tax=Nocardioides sp. TaxID=35761 RepID=UPI00260B6096|nr:trypsin-like peptidase domain-containing protein [Nocardioides sp.]
MEQNPDPRRDQDGATPPSHEPTRDLGPIWQAPPPSYAAAPVPPSNDRRPRRLGLAAAVVATSVLAGAAAGVGGAAAWDEWGPEDTASTTVTPAGTAQVSDATAPTAPAPDGSVQAAAEAVLPSVVRLNVRGSEEAGSGSGSGIILSEDGTILTNQHVVEPALDGGTISIDFADGSHAVAEVLGSDPLTDTAVIQAQDVSGLTPATLGSSEGLQVGQDVVAIGSPFGLDATVTSGIVSALDRPVDVGRDAEGNATVYPAVQTDAAINPGNSGGPLIDLAGRVVGINSSIRTAGAGGPFSSGSAGSIGLGFAIPIDEVMPIVEQMIAGETPTHARLGISVSDVGASVPGTGDEVPVTDGALVRTLGEGSTAEDAGLEEGDVITRIDDVLITSADSLVATIRSYRPGDEVEVTYERDGEEQTVALVLDSDAEES